MQDTKIEEDINKHVIIFVKERKFFYVLIRCLSKGSI